VDYIGWLNATNQPLDRDIARDYNWFALSNRVLSPPQPELSSMAVSAPGTAQFMLKAVIPAGNSR
jgi:hypothetical protein